MEIAETATIMTNCLFHVAFLGRLEVQSVMNWAALRSTRHHLAELPLFCFILLPVFG